MNCLDNNTRVWLNSGQTDYINASRVHVRGHRDILFHYNHHYHCTGLQTAWSILGYTGTNERDSGGLLAHDMGDTEQGYCDAV